jgi:uracil-DNA glycosylase
MNSRWQDISKVFEIKSDWPSRRDAIALSPMNELMRSVQTCTLCADRFATTETQHAPRPVTWFDPKARILIAGQAPGARVHASGKPFTDPSGDRLRDWLDVDEDTFYDRSKFAIVPMAFCFPGYDKKGSDLPPPPICAKTWRQDVMDGLSDVKLTLLVGSYAIRWHLGLKSALRDVVADWRSHAPGAFVLPHPSWRNTGWIKKNPHFETEILPALRAAVRDALA